MFSRKILIIDKNRHFAKLLAESILNSSTNRPAPTFFTRVKDRFIHDSSAKLNEQDEREFMFETDFAENAGIAVEKIRNSQELNNGYSLVFITVSADAEAAAETIKNIWEVDEKIQVVTCIQQDAGDLLMRLAADLGRRDNLLTLKLPYIQEEPAMLAYVLTEKYYDEKYLRHSQKMETMGMLSAGLAHDFNNIMSGLQATLSSVEYSLESAASLKKLKEEVNEDMKTMNEALLQGAEMVKVLMSISKWNDLPLSPVDLNELATQIVHICSRTISKSVIIEYTPLDEPAIVSAYPIQIEQVLLNLCINAEHAMTIMRDDNKKKGGILAIEIFREKLESDRKGTLGDIAPGDYFVVSISDTGVGIPKELISQVFEPFFTTKSMNKGTGLGLSMVLKTIKKHKGFTDVITEKNKGTTFLLYFPVIKREKENERTDKKSD